MKIKITKLQIVKEYLSKIAGDSAVKICEICENKKEGVKDEYLQKRIKIKITEVRTLLNKLHYLGIMRYDRKKDVKSGWYHYTWFIDTNRLAELIIDEHEKELERLKNKLKETKEYDYFACKNFCNEVPFEVAAEYSFKCPVCSKQMNFVNKKKVEDYLKKRIDLFEKEIKTIKVVLQKDKKHTK
ncbi:MAG: hypothetical protein N3D73_01870 [Candidatus Diapherotrites archaeon]|nr:hypothetical protein [Candidatus Diapherotrites archaeon]